MPPVHDPTYDSTQSGLEMKRLDKRELGLDSLMVDQLIVALETIPAVTLESSQRINPEVYESRERTAVSRATLRPHRASVAGRLTKRPRL
jgi:hypothetical protein